MSGERLEQLSTERLEQQLQAALWVLSVSWDDPAEFGAAERRLAAVADVLAMREHCWTARRDSKMNQRPGCARARLRNGEEELRRREGCFFPLCHHPAMNRKREPKKGM